MIFPQINIENEHSHDFRKIEFFSSEDPNSLLASLEYYQLNMKKYLLFF